MVRSPKAIPAGTPRLASRLTKGRLGPAPVQTRAPRSSPMARGQDGTWTRPPTAGKAGGSLSTDMPGGSPRLAVASHSSDPAGGPRTPPAVARSDASHTVKSAPEAPDSQPSMPAPRAPLQPSSGGASAGAGVGGGGPTAISALEVTVCATWLLLWWRLRTDCRPWRSRLGARPLERPG
jgi:hypothetical protein